MVAEVEGGSRSGCWAGCALGEVVERGGMSGCGVFGEDLLLAKQFSVFRGSGSCGPLCS